MVVMVESVGALSYDMEGNVLCCVKTACTRYISVQVKIY
jgi:hypothetical protein